MEPEPNVLGPVLIDLGSVDPASYEGLSLDEVAALLRARASSADPDTLAFLLDGPEGIRLPGAVKEELVERYVSRRLATVRGLRDLRTSFVEGGGS